MGETSREKGRGANRELGYKGEWGDLPRSLGFKVRSHRQVAFFLTCNFIYVFASGCTGSLLPHTGFL